MSNLKVFKKGEILVHEGDRNKQILLISSGLVAICVVRDKKNVELYRAGTGQVICEELLTATVPSAYTVVALNETKIFEAPVDLLQQQIESCGQPLKLLVKAVIEKQKTAATELKKLKLEMDPSPCPPDNIAKVFGVIFHTANFMGTKKDGKLTVNWPSFKKYAQRVFLESPLRLEQAMNILVKLKMAEKQMIKNDIEPDAPDELGFFHLSNMAAIERFFDFYQNYHFKPGYQNLLKYDEKCMLTANALLKVSEGEPVDHKGTVNLNFKDTMDKMKVTFGPSFSIDSVDRLQQKGLFVKRESNAKGGSISYLKNDFEIMIENWKILREIEKWNELGFVDLNENQAKKPAAQAGAAGIPCPSCTSPILPSQKFCGECGHKITQAA